MQGVGVLSMHNDGDETPQDEHPEILRCVHVKVVVKAVGANRIGRASSLSLNLHN